MKDYRLFDNFAIRTPLFPLIKTGSVNNVSDLKETIRNNEAFQEALLIASPDLYGKMEAFLADQLKKEKDIERVPLSILKYYSRASARCTPFGLFAGIGTGVFHDQTDIIRSAPHDFRKRVRLDMAYISLLVDHLLDSEAIRQQLLFFPNTSLYTLADQLRYVEYTLRNGVRYHRIASVDNSPYLQHIFKGAKNGATLDELSKLLVDDEITMAESQEFMVELVENQLLVSEIEPMVTGSDFFQKIQQKVGHLQGAEDEKRFLQTIDDQLAQVNSTSVGKANGTFKKLTSALKIPGKEIDKKQLFQTDLYTPFQSCQINAQIKNNLLDALGLLNQFSAKESNRGVFQQFKESFTERFEEEAVPLSFVFDSELGLGYRQSQSGVASDITPLVDDLALPTRSEPPSYKLSATQSFLWEKYIEAIDNHSYTIEITKEEVGKLNTSQQWEDLPDTMHSMVKFLNKRDEQQIIMQGAGGPSAANLLARFGYLDKSIQEMLLSITEKEEELKNDKILAEIVHLPQSRLGNILFRPVIRKYEIPYLAQSSLDKAHQIPIEDLLLKNQNGRLILWSKHHEKEVLPRLTNAHNYAMNSLPIYHFLCDLQKQNQRSYIGFNWGLIATNYQFLPRVQYKNIILSPAKWQLKKEDIKGLKDLADAPLVKAVENLRTKHNIPEAVALVEGDNELYIDLTSPLFIKMLLDAVKKYQSFQLVEFLQSPENALVKDEQGNKYMNQIVFAFHRNQ